MLTDTDFWWHISAGDFIRQNTAIPYSDTFSFTAAPYSWLNISWLWDVLYSWLNLISPLYLPVVATALVNALTVSILAAFMLKRGAGVVVVIFVILLGLAPYSYMLTPRPHEMTFFFTILFYSLCHQALNEKKYHLLTYIPPLMVLWVNMHGGFIVGFMIISAYFLQVLITSDKKALVLLLLTGLACLAGTLINPLGVDIFIACQRTLSSALLPIISEWQPLKLDSHHLLHIVYLAAFVFTLRPFNKDVAIAEKLLSILWAIAAFQHERNLPIFVLLSSPALALNIKHMCSNSGLKNWLENKNRDFDNDLFKPKIRIAGLCLAITVAIILISTVPRQFINVNIPAENPIEEASFIREHYPDKNFLNDYFQGGYLLYEWRGNTRIFIDGRAETAYPSGIVADYLKFHYSQPGWEIILDKYNIDGIILPNDNSNLEFFKKSPAWLKVYSGSKDDVYIRR